ncbi:MAG: hypothetical protein IT384_11650 [Deltaproteobacteria bacterium]|nr:hypothetical protein [Deltaproteobacteria bacterium]
MVSSAHIGAIALAALLAPSSASSAEDELAVVVASGFDATIDANVLRAAFTSAERRWTGGEAIVALNYPPSHPLRVAFDRAVLELDPDGVGRFWVEQRIRGAPPPPRHVSSPQLVARLVGRLRGSIGYIPVAMVDPSLRVVARIRNGKLFIGAEENRP